MKKIKKIFAVLLSLAMVLGMSITTLAAAPQKTKPTANDAATAQVTNVMAEGVTVTAYQIVDADYNSEGFTGYKWVTGIGKDVTKSVFDKNGELNLTDVEITDLATNAATLFGKNGIEMDLTKTAGTYEKKLEVGTYMVLVTGSNTTVYNPMLVSVAYKTSGTGDNNTPSNGSISANANWTLVTSGAYAKSSEPSVDKTIVGSGSGNDHGDDVAVNGEVSFQIKTQFPSYSKQYTTPQFTVTDKLSKGLTYKENTLVIKDGNGNAISSTNYDKPSITTDATSKETTIVVNFKSDYIAKNQGLGIFITYDAILNSEAGINFVPNTNSVRVEYSNDPSDSSKLTKKEDITYHYTFGIDAKLNGTTSEKTQELYKVDENGTVTVEGKKVTVTEPLKGAKFELRKPDGTVVASQTSADDGSLEFTGLDAGSYKLVEVEAPSGYSLDATPHDVVISATYYTEEANKGKLKSYTISIDNQATSTYSATYSGGTTTTTVDKTGSTGIKNTRIGTLPSTGGIGTTIFTIGGCLIMITAAGLFFASRRKSAKK